MPILFRVHRLHRECVMNGICRENYPSGFPTGTSGAVSESVKTPNAAESSLLANLEQHISKPKHGAEDRVQVLVARRFQGRDSA